MATFPTEPAPELIEQDLSLPGLVQPAEEAELPSPPCSAVESSEPEPEVIPVSSDPIEPVDELEELEDLPDLEEAAHFFEPPLTPQETLKAPEKPAKRPIDRSPEYHRLLAQVEEIEKRQRQNEKSILMLAGLCALVIWRFSKVQQSIEGPAETPYVSGMGYHPIPQ